MKSSSSDKPSPITKTLHGYSSSQRLKVINAFNSIRKNFRAAKLRADAAANQRAQKNNNDNQSFQMDATPKQNMFPDQRNLLLNNLSGNIEDSIPPLVPPPALPTFSGSFPVPEAPQQQQNEQSSTSIPLTSPKVHPPQQQTLTEFFDSPAFKLFQKTNPNTVQQILGNAIQKNASSAASNINENVVNGKSQEPTIATTSTAQFGENSNLTSQNNKNTSEEQQPLPTVPENQTTEPRQVEKPTRKYIPSVRTTQQNLFVKSALGALSCLHNLSDETLKEERMQREREEAIAKAQRPSYRHRSRDYRDDEDRDRSSRDRERRRKRSRSRSRDRNRDRSRERRRTRDRSRDRGDRERDRSRERGRSREHDKQPVGEEIPLYAKKDYANIWRKKMEEVENNFSKKYTRDTSNNEESQSEGPLVIDTGLYFVNLISRTFF